MISFKRNANKWEKEQKFRANTTKLCQYSFFLQVFNFSDKFRSFFIINYLRALIRSQCILADVIELSRVDPRRAQHLVRVLFVLFVYITKYINY